VVCGFVFRGELWWLLLLSFVVSGEWLACKRVVSTARERSIETQTQREYARRERRC